MLDIIIEYYLNELSAKKLVFGKMKLVTALFSIGILLNWSLFVISASTNLLFLLIIIPSTYILFFYFNKKVKKCIRSEYGIPFSQGLWSGTQYQLYVQNQLKRFIESKRINNKEKLDLLIARLSKVIEETKITVYFIPGVFLGFMVPSWAAYNTTILFKDKNYESATVILVSILAGLIMLTFLIGMIKHVTNDIFSMRRQRLIQLLNSLQDIQLDYILQQESETNRSVTIPNRKKTKR